MLDRWMDLCRRIGAAGDPAALHLMLIALYDRPPRAYHNLCHVGACLTVLDQLRHLAIAPDCVEFGLWLHDCVYEPLRKDNEARSAAVAAVFGREIGVSPSFATAVNELIDATRHTGLPLAGDTALIADLDMSILAAPTVDYHAYAAAIRKEYGAVPEGDYCRGRSAFLEGLLKRSAIFHIPELRERWELSARANLRREIETLRGTDIP